jgi:hypothetical protein
MPKIVFVATVIAACASVAWAQEDPHPDTQLPTEITQRIAELRSYGDRFEDAIRLIEAEARKPDWGWASCGHERRETILALPES